MSSIGAQFIYLMNVIRLINKHTWHANTHSHARTVQCIRMQSNAWVDRMIVLLLHVIPIIYVKLNTKPFILNNKHWPSKWNQSFRKAIFWCSKQEFRMANFAIVWLTFTMIVMCWILNSIIIKTNRTFGFMVLLVLILIMEKNL